MKTTFTFFTFAILLLLCHSGQAVEKRAPDPMPITPEREAAALTFVELHHPELTELLKGLKQQNKNLYQKAIRDLYRSSERLSLYVQRDEPRYEAELRFWKAGSRIQLATALYKTAASEGKREELKSRLRTLLTEQADAKLAILTLERERAQQRLDKIEEQIEKLTEAKNGSLENHLKQLIRQRTVPVKQPAPEKRSKEKSPSS